MGSWDIQDPETGQILKIDSDDSVAPTEKEIEELFTNFYALPEKEQARISHDQEPVLEADKERGLFFPLNEAAGAMELIGAVSTAMLREAGAGIAGIAQAVNPFAEAGAGAEAVEAVQGLPTYTPQTPTGQRNVAALGGAIEGVSGAINEAVAPMGRTLEILAGQKPEQAQETYQNIIEQGPGQVLGERIFEETGSPLAATMGQMAPSVAMDVALVGGPKAIAAGARGAGAAVGRMAEGAMTKKMPELNGMTPQEGHALVSEAIKNNDMGALKEIVRPNREFYQALDELDMDIEPLASFASGNPQFIAVEQALARIPSSQLADDQKAFMVALSKKADALIEQYGGTLDKGALSDRFKAENVQMIDALATQEEKLFGLVSRKVRPGRKVPTPNTAKFLSDEIKKFGGMDKLPLTYKQAMKQLGYTADDFKAAVMNEEDLPTYANFDYLREEIGRGTEVQGEFKDASKAILKKLYGRMKKDQELIAEQYGALDELKAADAKTIQRKQLEANMVKLLGKTLEGSLMGELTKAFKTITKGDFKHWDKIMSRIPNKAMRQEAVLSGLIDHLRDPKKFSDFMVNIERQPAAASRLYRELPPSSVKAIKNMKTVSDGITRAAGERLGPSEMNKIFNSERQMWAQLLGFAAEATTRRFVPGRIGMVVREFVRQSTDASIVADRVLSSAKFKLMINSAAKEGFMSGSPASRTLLQKARAFEVSPVFKNWSQALNPDSRALLSTAGVLNYLFRQEDEK